MVNEFHFYRVFYEDDFSSNEKSFNCYEDAKVFCDFLLDKSSTLLLSKVCICEEVQFNIV